MSPRINAFAVHPEALKPMTALEEHLAKSDLGHTLVELVKTRASQINGCAFCLHMHTADARAGGESEERLHLLAAWWESSLYTERERAALAWTEALTRVADSKAPDEAYEPLKAHFSDKEIVDLTVLIMTINAWNRLAVGLRTQHPRSWAKAAA